MTALAVELSEWSAWPTLGALLAFFAIAVMPGLTWGLCRPRGAAEPRHAADVLAAGVAVGFVVWVLSASLLVRLGAMKAGPLWSMVLVLSTACATTVVTRRLRRPVEDPRAMDTRGSEPGCRDRDRTLVPARVARLLPLALPFGVSGSVGLPQLVTVAENPSSLVSPTAWYYWLTVQSVAVEGGVPEAAHEWGETTPAFTFHFGFSAATAALSVAMGDPDSLIPAQVVRMVTVLVFGVGVWCLAKALGASDLSAGSGVALASFVQIYAIKLSSFRPEALAYGLACLSVALLWSGLRARDRWLLASSVMAAVGVSQVHGLTALLTAAMMVGVCAAYALGLLRPGDSLGTRAATAGLYALTAAAAAVSTSVLMTGKWSEATAAGGLPSMGEDDLDPTWAFARLVSAAVVTEPPGSNAPSIADMARGSLEASFLGSSGWWVPLVCVLCFSLYLGVQRDRNNECLAALVFGFVSFLSLLSIAYLLSLMGATYVPRRTGFSRVLQLWPLLPVVVLAAAVGCVRHGAWRRAVTAVLLVATAAAAAVATPRIVDLGDGQPTRPQLEEIAALPIEHGATVLTNAFTQGFVTLWTPGHGLLDGHAPYLERDLLARSTLILERARSYFRTPARSPFPFERYGVDYVLVAKRPYALGTPANFAVRLDRLSELPRLRLLTESSDVVLYEVMPAPSRPSPGRGGSP